jgi:hypothetical protein
MHFDGLQSNVQKRKNRPNEGVREEATRRMHHSMRDLLAQDDVLFS